MFRLAKEPDQNLSRLGGRGHPGGPGKSLGTRTSPGRGTRGCGQTWHQAGLAVHCQSASPHQRCHARAAPLAVPKPEDLARPPVVGHLRLDGGPFVSHAHGGGRDSWTRRAALVGQLRGMGAVQKPEQSRRRTAAIAKVPSARLDHDHPCGRSRLRPHGVGPDLPADGRALRHPHQAGRLHRMP